jgi:hypothetical protein
MAFTQRLTVEQANALLPEEKTKAPTDARFLKYLVIGPPKWGKTTFGCSCPNSILLATEEGHLFHETHKIVVDAWDKHREDRGLAIDDTGTHHLSLVESVDAICASNKFQFVVVDTADMAAKMCLDWHYQKFGVNHASDAGDYGRGWDLCLTQPFRQQITKLMKSGRGIMFITHTNLIEKKVGTSVMTRYETTLPSQVQKFLHTQADIIIHATFGKKRKGFAERDRVISMDGSNEILAGSRVRGIKLPKKFIVDPDQPWTQWSSFFTDEGAVAKAEADYTQLVLGGKEAEESAAEPQAQTISEPTDVAPTPEERTEKTKTKTKK